MLSSRFYTSSHHEIICSLFQKKLRSAERMRKAEENRRRRDARKKRHEKHKQEQQEREKDAQMRQEEEDRQKKLAEEEEARRQREENRLQKEREQLARSTTFAHAAQAKTALVISAIEQGSVRVLGFESLSGEQRKHFAEETLLHIAARTGNPQLVTFLLQHGLISFSGFHCMFGFR